MLKYRYPSDAVGIAKAKPPAEEVPENLARVPKVQDPFLDRISQAKGQGAVNLFFRFWKDSIYGITFLFGATEDVSVVFLF